MNSVYWYLFLVIYCDIANSNDETIECRDESGKAVDWYVLYKLPKIRESSDPIIRKGTKYLYITSKTISDGWKLSKEEISSKNSIPARTLNTLYNNDVASDALWIMYSDQAPNKLSNSRYGHAKGIVMTDKSQGFWFIHSVPNYPPIPLTGTLFVHRQRNNSDSYTQQSVDENNKKSDGLPDGEYSYPTSGTHFGQSFLCISVESNQMNVVGLQLMYNQVISYRYNLPTVLSKQFPSLVNASKKIYIKHLPYIHKVDIQSRKQQQFISFAKSDKWQKDLYDDFIAPQLQTDLLTETWLNGPGKLPSECNGTRVLNVQSIVLNTAHVDFKSARDHSKWAVATDNKRNQNWVCIGDINRADTQFNRGGGAICVNLFELWRNYRNAVSEIEPCPKKSGIMQRIGS